MCRTSSENQNHNYIVLGLVLLAVAIICSIFVRNFNSQILSPNIIDWGAFGSYIGGTMGFISVFLVFLTYNNQVKTNRRMQFEALLFQMAGNLKTLQTESRKDWERVFDGLCNYYGCDSCSTESLSRDNIFNAIRHSYNYYSSGTDIERFMTVFDNIISYIANESTVEDDRKKEYYAFLSSQMSNETMIIIMLQLIAKKKCEVKDILDKTCFFKGIRLDNNILERILVLYYPKTSKKTDFSVTNDNNTNMDNEQGIGDFMDYYTKNISGSNNNNT